MGVLACALVQSDEQTRSNYRDLNKVFYITLVNNNIIEEDIRAVGRDENNVEHDNLIVEESIYGSLYFFKSVLLLGNLRQ